MKAHIPTFRVFMKPPKGNSELLASLVKKAEADVSLKVPVVMRRLYELDPNESTTSILEELINNGPKQKNILRSREDVRALAPQAPKLNILRFECKNAYIGRRDFFNIQPVARERLYAYVQPLTKGLRFDVVKARDPLSLLFTGAYYLIFPNHLQACLYYMETRDRLINGFDVNLEFVSPVQKHLSRMGSPLLEPSNLLETLLSLTSAVKTSFENVFGKSTEKSLILEKLKELQDAKDDSIVEPHPNYKLLQRFLNIPSRYQLVLVKNLPFGVNNQIISSLLWDYRFLDVTKPEHSWRDIVVDPATQTHLTLIKFGDEQSAFRFVRNHHGRKWEPLNKEREKQLYQPVLCEILE